MNLSIMLNFQKQAFQLRVSEKVPKGNFTQTTQSEHISWECPKKQDKSKFCKNIKKWLCIVKNRRRPPSQNLRKHKNWRIHITGYQSCKFGIWWKNAESDDLRCLPRRSLTAEVRSGARKAHFLRKLPWIYRFWKINVYKMEPGEVGVRDGIGG